MRGGAPPDLKITRSFAQTDPVPGTAVGGIAIPAPGVSRRLRLWSWIFGFDWPIPAATMQSQIVDIFPGATTVYGRITLKDVSNLWGQQNFVGGFVLPLNTAIYQLTLASAASVRFEQIWHYTVEEV